LKAFGNYAVVDVISPTLKTLLGGRPGYKKAAAHLEASMAISPADGLNLITEVAYTVVLVREWQFCRRRD
jgi:hypothetical protein